MPFAMAPAPLETTSVAKVPTVAVSIPHTSLSAHTPAIGSNCSDLKESLSSWRVSVIFAAYDVIAMLEVELI